MKSIMLAAACFVILWFDFSPLKAQPFAGADLTLTCTGGNDYIVRFVLYRDCEYINAPSTVTFQFKCSSNPAYNFDLTGVPKLAGSVQQVMPACPSTLTRCSGGSYLGIEEHVYQAQVQLPPCGQWRVSCSPASRGPSQTTNPTSGEGGYIEATTNTLLAPCNNSVVFTENPLRILCTGQTNIINHGALDPDGDSLSYSMVNPLTWSNSYITWIPPYSATQPILSNPPVTLDPVTGEITMTPTTALYSLMLLKVDQWRTLNGVPTLIGTSYRDIKLYVMNCSNQLPSLAGMDTTSMNGYDPGDTVFQTFACIGDTVRFNIWGHDPDIGNAGLFHIEWNQGIPQAIFQVFNQDSDSAYARFVWVPKASDRKLNCFTATIHDLACPYNGVQTYTYCLTGQGISTILSPDTAVCLGGSVTFTATADPPAADYLWQVDGVPVFTPAPSSTLFVNTTGWNPGEHIVSVTTYDGSPASVCSGYAAAHLTVLPNPVVLLGNDTTLAPEASILLDAGPGYSSYFWNTGHTSQTLLVDSSGIGTGMKTIWIEVADSNSCTAADTIRISFSANPGVGSPMANASLQLFPNPSDGILRLHLNNFPAGDYDVSVFTVEGRLAFQTSHNISHDRDEMAINLAEIPAGIYTVRVRGEGGILTRMLLVQPR